MSARVEALFTAAARGIAAELELREAMRGMPNGDERRELVKVCRTMRQEYERATEEALYLRGIESGYDLRAYAYLEADDPRILRTGDGTVPSGRDVGTVPRPARALRRDVDDAWTSQEPLL